MLAYHGVGSDLPWPLAIPLDVLEQQLSLFKKLGYVGLTFSRREQLLMAGDLPQRSVVVTFDDGDRSTPNAAPLLKRLGYPATIFPILSFIESGEPERWPKFKDKQVWPATWEQLSGLAEEGWEIGSHTVTHSRLTTLDDAALARELSDSRSALAARFGACETIAYPHGAADARVARATEDAGYLAGCTLTSFHVTDEPMRRPRIGLGLRTGRALRSELSWRKTALRPSRIRARSSGAGRAELSRA